MASASTPPAPQSSALPPSHNPTSESSSHPPPSSPSNSSTSKHPTVRPQRKPLLRLELRDLSSSGSRAFLRLLHASTTLEDAVDTVLRCLYTGMDTHCIPPTRSITLVLRSMNGVAYTTGLDIDDDHKEIHFSTNYIEHVSDSRLKEEMQGVIVHEMVHCWQHSNGAPGGLIEGIADWVRLKAGFAPPHWRRHGDCDWDAGYERTAYFLEWLEGEHGEGVVRRINDCLRESKYKEGPFWEKCCGKSIERLWKEYRASLGYDDKGKEAEEGAEVDGQAQEDAQDTDEKQEESHVEAEEKRHDGTPEHDKPTDTRSARVKARRGGNMHVPVRPPFT